ncbi:copper resistance protein CopC [Promicromonospora sp. NPDC057488]|uniref:copper resistance CopC/CopD family protein n=1 Tax=Promicromonospora sp. NPDC057488 TaxID=3346147 RepID=UPI003670F1CD
MSATSATGPTSAVRRAGGWLLLLTVLTALLVGPAGSASAHATLISTDPAQGAVLETAPERVTFTFNESVIGVPAGIKVFDATGTEVASTATVRASRLLVDLDEEVADGTLVVVWRLVSEDGHPIGGSLSFAVGAPSDVVDVPGTGADAGTEAPVLLGVVRGVGYVGLLLAAGLAAFAVLFLPRDPAADRSRARLRPVARVAAGVGALGWALAVPLVALYQLGLPASALADGDTWTVLAAAEYAVPAAVVAGLALAACALPVAVPGPGRGQGRAALVLAGCALAVTAPAFTGHTRAATPEVLVLGVDVLHLAAGSLWLGGLVAIALVLGDLARGEHGAVVLGSFSTWAAGLLAVLVVAGTVLAWRISGSWAALLDSGYGALLLVKVLAALVAIGIAAWNRYALLPRFRAVAARPEPARRPPPRGRKASRGGAVSRGRTAPARTDRSASATPLVRTALAEAGVLVVVLAVTGFLVDRSPETASAVAAEGRGESATESVRLDDVSARITLDPVAVGPATLTIEMTDPAGEPAEGFEAPRMSLASDEVELGELSLSSLGPGVYAGDVVLPTTGEWEVQVSLRTTEFDNPVRTVTFVVPGAP